MNQEQFREASSKTFGEALRAVERQKQNLPMMLSADERAQRAAFFHFLDSTAADLFALVATTAGRDARQVRITDVPALAASLPGIFHDVDCHDFKADMFNDWLFSKDLSHHFHADGTYLKW